ncbi:peptidoglycan D,D-transpeptidase FtsI family protein [Acetonema longum]|uniref:Peptidoglycan glycosyltransferase n=1 Tax=Acetonema longum DSM 6540 TaxID=1009370 RepID=F7NI81_9FIRM|nr:penicillin-binding protein 2 [Acetonema longum]EGO64246.1 peptidoglycan glycosyltransferase [Acetonema longum DSM 6540]
MAFHVNRIYHLVWIFLFSVILLIGRLFYLQILESDQLSISALKGRILEVPLAPPRGDILDRYGLSMTNIIPETRLIIFPAQLIDSPRVLADLIPIIGAKEVAIIARLAQNTGQPFSWRIPDDPAVIRQLQAKNIPGVVLTRINARYSNLASHVIGYMNAADNQGVSGIEQAYDHVLRGLQASYVAAMIDASQKPIPGLGFRKVGPAASADSGQVVLTLDRSIQSVVERVLDRHMEKGSVVILDPRSGEVLAMASRPNFRAEQLSEYLNLTAAPLINRAVMGYQPGSVFKLVIAAAALEEKVVQPNQMFFDAGYIDVNNIRFQGWDYEKGSRGQITFTQALAYSSNPVFIQVGLTLGAEKVITYAQKFGFGQSVGLAIKDEVGGNLPNPGQVYAGDLANLSIGQGMLEVTPIQVASLVATLINDGIKVQPRLVKKVVEPGGRLQEMPAARAGVRVVSARTASALREMMKAVTSYGTGVAAQVDRYGSAGKTGSAETGKTGVSGKSINHAWFAGYAPLNNPRYVAVVFIEEGMSGSDVAAPIFREIMENLLQ